MDKPRTPVQNEHLDPTTTLARKEGRDQPMTAMQESPPSPHHSPSPWLALSVLALALLVAVGVRVRLLDFPLERDEGGYAYIGQLILEGIPPFQLATDVKMPGIYLAYATAMSVFGQTAAGIHLGLLVVHLTTLIVLFLIARRFLDLYGAAIATAVYALMTLSPAYLGIAAHPTHFVMLPVLLGLWLLLRMKETGGLFDSLASGCLFGIAFLMKQHGVFFGIFGGLYLAWISIAGKVTWRLVLERMAVYSLGCLLPFLAVCIWLHTAGVFPQFWFWTVSYPLKYKATDPFNMGIENARLIVAKIFHAAPLLWVIAGMGSACLCVTRQARNMRMFLAGLIIFSCLAVCPGLYFREHYFIVVLPAVALLDGLAVSWSGRWLAKKHFAPWLRHLPFLLAALACAQSLYADRAVLFSLAPRDACRAVYGLNPFPESIDIADYIERNTRKDQRIAVIGSEPQIYFYAHRRSSTAQIFTYPLMEAHPFATRMQEDMIREIEQHPPEYLVFISIPTSWPAGPNTSLLISWVNSYVKQNMQLVGLIQLTGPQTTETVWGPDAATTPLHSQFYAAVYGRRDKVAG